MLYKGTTTGYYCSDCFAYYNMPSDQSTTTASATIDVSLPATAVSFSMWVKLADTGGVNGVNRDVNYLFSYSESAANTNALWMTMQKDGDARFRVNGASAKVVWGPIGAAEWAHYVVTWDSASGVVYGYTHGAVAWVQQSTADTIATGTSIPGSGKFVFGQDQDTHGGSFDHTQSFYGSVYNFAIWDGVVTSSQAATLAYHADGIAPLTGISAFAAYPFANLDATSVGTWDDAIGSNDLVWTGGATRDGGPSGGSCSAVATCSDTLAQTSIPLFESSVSDCDGVCADCPCKGTPCNPAGSNSCTDDGGSAFTCDCGTGKTGVALRMLGAVSRHVVCVSRGQITRALHAHPSTYHVLGSVPQGGAAWMVTAPERTPAAAAVGTLLVLETSHVTISMSAPLAPMAVLRHVPTMMAASAAAVGLATR